MRYSSGDAAGMAGCGAHDVFSFNLYRPEPETALTACARRSDVPMIIGEYHIGGGDKGNLAHGLLASPTQEERGKALEYYHLQDTNRHMYDFVQGKRKPTEIKGELERRR